MQKKLGLHSHFFTADMTIATNLSGMHTKKRMGFWLILSFDISYTKLLLSVKFA